MECSCSACTHTGQINRLRRPARRRLAAVCVIARTAGIAMPAARPVAARPTADAALKRSVAAEACASAYATTDDRSRRDRGRRRVGRQGQQRADLSAARDELAPLWQGHVAFGPYLDQKQPGHDPTPLAGGCAASASPLIWSRRTRTASSWKTAPTEVLLRPMLSAAPATSSAHTRQIGAQRLALGHRDDALETLLLNMVHQGTMKAMPARYVASRGVGVSAVDVLRGDLREYATRLEFPILPCNLCGSQPAGRPSQRQGAKHFPSFCRREARTAGRRRPRLVRRAASFGDRDRAAPAG